METYIIKFETYQGLKKKIKFEGELTFKQIQALASKCFNNPLFEKSSDDCPFKFGYLDSDDPQGFLINLENDEDIELFLDQAIETKKDKNEPINLPVKISQNSNFLIQHNLDPPVLGSNVNECLNDTILNKTKTDDNDEWFDCGSNPSMLSESTREANITKSPEGIQYPTSSSSNHPTEHLNDGSDTPIPVTQNTPQGDQNEAEAVQNNHELDYLPLSLAEINHKVGTSQIIKGE